MDGFRRRGIEAHDRTRPVWIGRGVLGLKGSGEGVRSFSVSSLSLFSLSSNFFAVIDSSMEPMLKLEARLQLLPGEDIVDVEVEVDCEEGEVTWCFSFI